MPRDQRFSDVLRAMNVALLTLSAEDLSKARKAFPECFAERGEGRTLEDGRVVPSVEVNFAPLREALQSSPIARDVRDMERAANDEIRLRGSTFEAEGLHLCLAEYLTALVDPDKTPLPVAKPKAKAKAK